VHAEHRIRLSRQRIAALAAATTMANVVFLLGTYFHRVVASGLDWRVRYVTRHFSLTGENAMSVWYASMLLLLVGLAALACFGLDWRASTSKRERQVTAGWLLMATAFVILSIDELGSMHERLGALTQLDPTGGRAAGWVGPLLIPILAVAAFLSAFAWHLMRRSWVAAVFMAAGVVCFLSIPLQEHLERVMMTQGIGAAEPEDVRPVGWALLEEGTEVFGTMFFLLAALTFLRYLASGGGAGASSQRDPGIIRIHATPATIHRLAISTVAVLLCGLLLIRFGFMPFFEQKEKWGNPLNWFPAALALLAAMTAVAGWLNLRRRGAPAGTSPARLGLPLFAVVSLAVSVDHGAAQVLSHAFWSMHAAQRVVVDLLVIALIGLGARALWIDPVTASMRRTIMGWAILSSAAVAGPASAAVALSFSAYAVLLPGLARSAWMSHATAKAFSGQTADANGADRASLLPEPR
jgi:hypothetical protein